MAPLEMRPTEASVGSSHCARPPTSRLAAAAAPRCPARSGCCDCRRRDVPQCVIHLHVKVLPACPLSPPLPSLLLAWQASPLLPSPWEAWQRVVVQGKIQRFFFGDGGGLLSLLNSELQKKVFCLNFHFSISPFCEGFVCCETAELYAQLLLTSA